MTRIYVGNLPRQFTESKARAAIAGLDGTELQDCILQAREANAGTSCAATSILHSRG